MKLVPSYFRSIYLILIITSFTFSYCSSPTETDLNNSSNDLEKILENTSVEDLSPLEKEGLIFMREEEKLARDVYITLYEKWNMKVFNNISFSEQRHTKAIELLLDRYGIEDPMDKDEIGIFQNEDLQNLYTTLIERGNESVLEALIVGGAVEEIDILDLELHMNENVYNEDIMLVYSNLLRGSRNHLRAFVRNLTNQGVTYEPQYLSQEAYQVIIDGEMERGGKGNRNRKGKKGNG